ncbi:MAG: hypothetical protein ACI9SI_001646 [Polaribacter sp.]|jgi:hypothetical protein
MKKHQITTLSTVTIALFLTLSITAQKRINAADIMRDIKNGKDIRYKNVTIVGILDFTFMEEQQDKLPRKKRNSWWNTGSKSNKIKKNIKNNVSFVNCVFEDSVFAYIHDEDSGYTFTANFNGDAIFKKCVFKEMAMFKYSYFEEKADFEGSEFNDSSTFKYAKFSNNVSFANTLFKESATFKYSKFNDGVSFNNAKFEEDLNIKYTQIFGEFDIKGMFVAYDIDSKYTKINGEKFSYH